MCGMTREEFEELVFDTYSVRADYPFDDDLETGVFRHTGPGQWFALAMRITADKLAAGRGKMQTNVVNLKCAPEVIDSLVGVEPGIYRAYHMNKTHWLTLDLSECDSDTAAWLLGTSFELTSGRGKRKKK